MYKPQLQSSVKILLIVSILVSIDFWSFLYWPNNLLYSALLFFVYLCFLCITIKTYEDNFIDKTVKWTIITVLLSIIPAMADYGQDFYHTFRQCLGLIYGLFLYFVLKRTKFPVKSIISIITVISSIWVFLEISQQFTYPSFLFSGRYLIFDGLEERMGLWRFYIWGVDFVMIAYAYWISNISIEKGGKRVKSILLMAFFLIGLLCYCSRKHIYTVLSILLLFGLSRKGKQKYIIITVTFLFLVVLLSNFYVDWQNLNTEADISQGEGENFIRILAAKYFINDFSESPLYPIFGAGMEVEGSKLYTTIHYLANMFGYMKGYFQADVGIIGYYSKFGLLGVSAIIMYVGYFIKNWKYIDAWLKYFFIMKMFLIVFDFWAIWDVGMMAYSIFLYILDCNIRKNKNKSIAFITNENWYTDISLRS